MKVGIILSGNYRTGDETSKSFRTCFADTKPFVFAQAWKYGEHQNKVWWNKTGSIQTPQINEIITEERIRKSFPFIEKVLIQEPREFTTDNPVFKSVIGYSPVKSMWEGIYQAYQLTKNYKLDIIIKTRYDISYENKINLRELADILNNINTLYLLPTPHALAVNTYADILWICTPKIMEKILQFRNEIDEHLNEAIKNVGYIEGEFPFTHYMKKNNNLNCKIKHTNLMCWLRRLNKEDHILYKK